MAVVDPPGLLNNPEVIDQPNIQPGGMRDVQAQRQDGIQPLKAGNDRHDWLKPFTNKGLTPAEEARRLEILELGKAVFEGYYGRKLKDLDQTGERAQPEVRSDIRRREQMIKLLLHEDKQIAELAGANDLPNERETQIFAVHSQKMIEAAIMQLIGGDREGTLNSLLSAHHACRIVAGDAQKRREMAVVNEDVRKVLETGGGVTLLLGNESKSIANEVLKNQKLTQQTSKSQNSSQLQSSDTKPQQQIQLQQGNQNGAFRYKKPFTPYNAGGIIPNWQNWNYQQGASNFQPNGYGFYGPTIGQNTPFIQNVPYQHQQTGWNNEQQNQKRQWNGGYMQMPKPPYPKPDYKQEASQHKNQ
ncbi:MAG: hypothetical protein EZS28_044381 [Streblomastix strix]|uniref:Uncharacterized protein n=2 Tax=Streblomastix strix TaxID=222440 RepID=A0A5J4TQB6_9EUKA|nr:MAG: hypothetical protein EZS28_044381 [Streblomastix strix]